MKPHLLAIDHGTQSVRALIFDLNGRLIDKAQIHITPYHAPHPNWAEQDPDYFWQKLCEACQLLWQQTAVPKNSIVGVALTTQRGTLINVDQDGRPLRPAIVWPDQRRATAQKAVGGLWGLAFKLVGMSRTVAQLQGDAEVNWIQQHQPEIWAKTAKFLFLSGYLHHKLCGRFVDSVSNQVGYLPFDYKKKTWAASWDWKWQAVPMSPDLLPELVPATEQLGEITPQAAAETGIPVGLPLIAAAADKACEVIGSGALDSHIGCLSYGTTATINTTQHKFVEAYPLIPPFPSAVPDAYSLEIQIYRGFWLVNWFKEEFGLEERQRAAELGVTPESLFDELVNAVPAGSGGLIVQPHWSPGIKEPGPEARGAMIGFNSSHTRAHIYRAILEGLAYGLREGAERIGRRSGIPITELRVSGGGSQSDAAMQLTADIFGLPAIRPHTYETSGLGAAIDAAVGLGLHPDFETAVSEMCHPGRRFEPDPQNHQLYDEIYHKVYKKLYGQLKGSYQQLARYEL